MVMRSWVLGFIVCFIITESNSQQFILGKEFSKKDKRLTTIVFLSTDCPISQKYIGELNNLNSRYSAEVFFIGIIPSKISKSEIAEFTKEYNVNFLIQADKKFRLLKMLKPAVTPEVFVIENTGTLRYNGAIDNWFYELGRYRQEISEHYLEDALKSALNGNDPQIKKTTAVGCMIQYPK
jgi:hypothetical protein